MVSLRSHVIARGAMGAEFDVEGCRPRVELVNEKVGV
jgi:hypothetical protein